MGYVKVGQVWFHDMKKNLEELPDSEEAQSLKANFQHVTLTSSNYVSCM